MEFDHLIDIKEDCIYNKYSGVLPILLIDRSRIISIESSKCSKKSKEKYINDPKKINVIWGTDIYYDRYHKLDCYKYDRPITVELITNCDGSKNGNIIKPRVKKSNNEKMLRSKINAEIFTPSWICNMQNNDIDEQWFGKESPFNTEMDDKSWKVNKKKIIFKKSLNKNWKDYVLSKRLEVSCGEAPYLVSRYDTVSGVYIEPMNRIGILDRKIRVVNENVKTEDEWIHWVKEATMATYGFDLQGDNILIARENILISIIEYYSNKFLKKLNNEVIKEFAYIISWNIWQMDALKYVIPNTCYAEKESQMSLFGDSATSKCKGCLENNYKLHNGIQCFIRDWKENKTLLFSSLKE